MTHQTIPYEQLPFTNNFIFCKVMSHNLDLTRQILQLILQMPIREVKLAESERSIEVAPDARGVRFDVYAEDTDGTVFDIEMQTTDASALGRRMRYYQSMIDIDRSERSMDFSLLPRSFVIFICLNKPESFTVDLPVYHFREICMEDSSLELGDGAEKVIVNASAPTSDLPESLHKFIEYLRTGMPDDALTHSIDADVSRVRRSKHWRKEYMTWEMELKLAEIRAEKKWKKIGLEEGRAEGLAEGRAEGLAEGRAEGRAEGLAEGVASATEQHIQRLREHLSLSREEALKILNGQ